MRERIYTSFEEVNRDKEIYKLQSQIDREKIKRSFFYLKETVSPVNIGASIAIGILQKRFLNKLLSKILPFGR